MFSYSLRGKQQKEKTKIVYVLKGRNKKPGFISSVNGEWIADNCFIVPVNVDNEIIRILREVIKDKEILKLLKMGYKEFGEMINDLFKAKKERTEAQYYTRTEFMKEKYKEKAESFLNNIVIPYLNKMLDMLK